MWQSVRPITFKVKVFFWLFTWWISKINSTIWEMFSSASGYNIGRKWERKGVWAEEGLSNSSLITPSAVWGDVGFAQRVLQSWWGMFGSNIKVSQRTGWGLCKSGPLDSVVLTWQVLLKLGKMRGLTVNHIISHPRLKTSWPIFRI